MPDFDRYEGSVGEATEMIEKVRHLLLYVEGILPKRRPPCSLTTKLYFLRDFRRWREGRFPSLD